MAEQRQRVEISPVQVTASALAAVSSAVLLSTVGVAGTLIGAALGSVIATVGSSVYSYYLRWSRDRVAAAQAAALARVSRARSSVVGAQSDAGYRPARAEQEMEQAHDELAQAEQELADAEEHTARPPWREILAGLPWKRIAVATAAVFAVTMVAIVSFELVSGRAISTYTGGSSNDPRTSIPGLGGSAKPTNTPSPTPSSTSTETPSHAPATTGPSAAPTTSAPGVTPSPSQAPTTTGPSSAPTTAVPSPAASGGAAIQETPQSTPTVQ